MAAPEHDGAERRFDNRAVYAELCMPYTVAVTEPFGETAAFANAPKDFGDAARSCLPALAIAAFYSARGSEFRMPYVVRWVPKGPDMSVTCHTMADVLALTSELRSSGRGMDVHVLQDDVELDVDALCDAETVQG